MKIDHSRYRQESGYILLMTVGFVLVVGILLGSYLLLSTQEDRLVVRSECWNSSLTVAEAGVDEALAQMNASPNDFSANGWSGSSGTTIGTFSPGTRTMADGSYVVKIVNTNGIPTILSTGYTTMPGSGQQLSRTVEVTAENEPLFSVGLGAVGNINMNGHGMITASWNSETNTLSTNGLFDPAFISTNGDVASEGGLVNLGNHTINGSLYLGPSASYSGSANQVTGDIYYDYNVQFPPVTLPSASWLPATVISGTNTFALPGTNYYYVNNSLPIYVAPGTTAILQVAATSFSPSSVTIGGGTTNSGTLIIYQDSGTVTLGGNASGGAIGTRPENFMYFGLPAVTNISLSGCSTFIGCIYAPEAMLTLNGGGNANNLEGSAIVGNATDNGHYDFWYDESLANTGPSRGFIPTSWQEL